MSDATERHAVLARLREEIRRLEHRPARRDGVVPCGLSEVDAALPGGGFPRGALAELSGGPASGKTAVVLSLFAALGPEALVAYVDGRAELYPPAAAARGVDLGRLLVVRTGVSAGAGGEQAAGTARSAPPHLRAGLWDRETIPGPSQAIETRAAQGATTERTLRAPPWAAPGRGCEGGATKRCEADRPPWRREGIVLRSLWAAEALLASGAFAAVAMDLPVSRAVEGADAVARRLQAAAERGGAVGLWLAEARGLRVPAAVRLELEVRGERIVARTSRGGAPSRGSGRAA